MNYYLYRVYLLGANILLYIVILGCSSIGPARPNIPFKGTYTKNFKRIEANNSLLAREIGKLPEFQDGISVTDEKALNTIINLYKEIPIEFDAAFNQMFQTGKPEYRRFCTPLQALFWIAEAEKQVQNLKELIVNYSLKNLLAKSWSFKNTIILTADEVAEVIAEVIDPQRKADYISFHIERGDMFLCRILQINYRNNHEFFTENGQEILKNVLEIAEINSLKNDRRWQNFNLVADRINSPELLDYYIKQNFDYMFNHGICCQSPRVTFNKKSGCCVCLALLGKAFLDRAGYNSFIRHLNGGNDQHGVLVVKQDYKYYIVVDFTESGNFPSGPFNNIEEVDEQISQVTGSPIIRKIYWNGECGY